MEVITRKKALDLGLKRYFTGEPCKYGHIGERYISNGECLICARLYLDDWRAKNADKVREHNRRSNSKKYKKDPIKINSYCRNWARAHPESALLFGAKKRAKLLDLAFDLELKDITIPDICPILKIPLLRNVGRAKNNSPSLDRVVPSSGYVKGNVQVISRRANMLKSNATLDELVKFGEYFIKYK